MKHTFFFRFVMIALLLGAAKYSYGQFSERATVKYCTILGSFASHDNAKRFVTTLAGQNIKAQYTTDASDKIKLYYVYTSPAEDSAQAEGRAMTFRKDVRFFDAWVKKFNIEPAWVDTTIQDQPTNNLTIENLKINSWSEKVSFLNAEVFLSLYNSTNNQVVKGNVKVVDPDQVQLVNEVNANEYIMLPIPLNKSGKVSLICDVFGYRRIQHEIDFKEPLKDSTATVELFGNTVIVHFDLVRYRRGDITSLYNVYFYNDAAIMTPESKFQLQELLTLMKEKPNFHIKLHGHSNGKHLGKIITTTSESNFFSLATDTKEMIGSAKMLSERRAEVVKKYLVFNGISADRIEVIGWGGKRPLFDAVGARAKKNLRVDVEITGD